MSQTSEGEMSAMADIGKKASGEVVFVKNYGDGETSDVMVSKIPRPLVPIHEALVFAEIGGPIPERDEVRSAMADTFVSVTPRTFLIAVLISCRYTRFVYERFGLVLPLS